ncbi:mitochondrial fission ELM1 family protein [Prosthecomicrobium sp. N25]|uniref:mitochondrial fission ELM1 family protein n=1 Tax=Prosthecomicrobium sp. N25 TaxID=3129254 RepID=UPI0030774E41
MIETADPRDARPKAWVLTDGKAGDVNPALGVVEALGCEVEFRRVAPRPPWVWFLPRGPIDPREAPERAGSPIAPPWPDLVVACGRRAIAYARVVKARAGARTFVLVLRDPRTVRHGADLLWVAAHDRRRGPDVLVTPTGPHRVSAARLAEARRSPPAWLDRLPVPRVAVLLGGGPGLEGLAPRLAALAPEAGSFLVTPSRRSDPAVLEAVRRAVAGRPSLVWDGSEPNPYFDFLAHADAIVVTGDSFNMVGEALATGRPVLVHQPTGLSRKLERFLAGLRDAGLIRPFEGRLEDYTYAPVDSTVTVAREVARRMAEADRGGDGVSESRPVRLTSGAADVTLPPSEKR